ncbi:ABC transporter ATP-binding protein [Pseudarthrobacter siccitolerans]|uniref:ABC transporter ATP-binding protein n=1 Tax=Pseudarthrobacter siccitolerans TaxID=861266 RepID=UPI000A7E2264|nr:ATP-binding cassette domain-containing protein [Pseudarthrobacter siccitolerans]
MNSESKTPTAVPLIQLDHIGVRYGSALALREINLSIAPGSIVGVVGPNGVGKTTLLRVMSGLLRPSQGRILWKGEDLGRFSPHSAVRKGIAHVPEGRRLIAELEVIDNLHLGAVAAGLSPKHGVDKVIEMFPAVERLLNRKAGQLSGGEQQMVAVGRGLMSKPELLLIDELSLGLAPKITVELFEALRTLARTTGLTLLLVDQSVRLLNKYVDDLWALSHGQLVPVDRTAGITSLDSYIAEGTTE